MRSTVPGLSATWWASLGLPSQKTVAGLAVGELHLGGNRRLHVEALVPVEGDWFGLRRRRQLLLSQRCREFLHRVPDLGSWLSALSHGSA